MNITKFIGCTISSLFLLLSAGSFSYAAESHKLMAVGDNAAGQLGDGTMTTDHAIPFQVATNVEQIAAGSYYSLFVKTDGTLWAMGHNYYGQLGDGTTTNRATPFQVATNVEQIAAGDHSLFVKTDGTLWAMGRNRDGELGDGTTTDRATPVQVATNVEQIAAGVTHSLFVKTDGTLWAMGDNYYGQLGDGTTTDRATPVQIATNVEKVAVEYYHSLFVKTDGTLWAMGSNTSGQLGDATSTSRYEPVQVATNVEQVAAGRFHSLFVKTDGTLWAMGRNYDGQIGDGTSTSRYEPVQVATNVDRVAAGKNHSLFVKTDGTLWAMGDNYYGQLGDGTATDRYEPVQIATNVAQVAAGDAHSLFLQIGDDDVEITGLELNLAQSPEVNTPVTVTVNADDSQTLYYKFFYRANYGTSDYESSPWGVAQGYSTTNSCDYTFPSIGKYIVVVRAVTDPNNEPADLPIIGGVIPVGGDNNILLTGLSSDATGAVSIGETVMYTVIGSNSNNDTIYYKWFYRANYGTSDYDSSPWMVVQNYAANYSCDFTFPAAGKYIIVVRAVTDPNDEPADLPIIGGVVTVN